MPKYYYHPLGEYAKYFIDNYEEWIADNLDVRQTFPHTYNGHGWGQLDWGVQADLPVYSMTDGEIVSIWTGSGRGNGLWVVVKTDRKDGSGKDVHITYGELEGLSEITAGLCGVEAGPRSMQPVSWSGSHPIKMGDMLGYTNNFNEYDYSNMHTDWHYEGTFDQSDEASHCTVKGANLVSAFTLEPAGGNQKVLFNGEVLGPDDGIYSPLQSGPSASETIYPTLQSMVMLQKPTRITSSKKSSGSLAIDCSEEWIHLLVGVVAAECGWHSTHIAHAVLLVARNWAYGLSEGKLNSDDSAAAKAIYSWGHGLSKQELLDRYEEWKDKDVTDANGENPENTVDFVKKIMTTGNHYTYTEKDPDIEYYNNCTEKDIEDITGFPGGNENYKSYWVCHIYFGNRFTNWNFRGDIPSELPKPSEVLGLQ